MPATQPPPPPPTAAAPEDDEEEVRGSQEVDPNPWSRMQYTLRLLAEGKIGRGSSVQAIERTKSWPVHSYEHHSSLSTTLTWLRRQIGAQWVVARRKVVIHYHRAKKEDWHQTDVDEEGSDWFEVGNIVAEFTQEGHRGITVTLSVQCDPAPTPPEDPIGMQQSQPRPAEQAPPQRGRGTATNVQL